MSKYISVSGSLVCTPEQALLIKEVLPLTINEASTYYLAREKANLYMRCWSFPEKTVNWLSYVFFGGSIQSTAIDYLQYQIISCSKELMVSQLEEKELDGCFYLIDEEDDRFMWEINKSRLSIYHINESFAGNQIELMRFVDI